MALGVGMHDYAKATCRREGAVITDQRGDADGFVVAGMCCLSWRKYVRVRCIEDEAEASLALRDLVCLNVVAKIWIQRCAEAEPSDNARDGGDLQRARERESWPKRRFDSVPRRAFSPNSDSVDLTPLSVARRSQPKKMQKHTAIFPSTAPTRPDEDLPDPASSTPHILATTPPLFLRSVRSTAS
ncbi:hypothetical protein L1887_40475 [Cichorium endivia]|nr:hypothetical protein L1887_40475 [Cichorium endivia]